MNLLILEASEVGAPLPRTDRRVEHVRRVLKKGVGDTLLAGILGGPGAPCPVGTARIESWDGSALVFSFHPETSAPDLRPVELILGFPRPIQAHRILKDLTSMGVRHIRIVGTELGEKSYAESGIFKQGAFRGALVEGAEQSGNPRVPLVEIFPSLFRCLESLAASLSFTGRWALDPYRSGDFLGAALRRESSDPASGPMLLAVGSERGWTGRELDALARAGFQFASMGDRLLRTETACAAAVSLALASMGQM